MDRSRHGRYIGTARSLLLSGVIASNVAFSIWSHLLVVSPLGIDSEADPVFAGFALPQYLVTVILGSAGYVLVPIFSIQGKTEIRHAIAGAFVAASVIFGVIAGLLVLSAGSGSW